MPNVMTNKKEKANNINILEDSNYSQCNMKFYISKIRELTNGLILKSLLLKDERNWNLMCGGLDAIESTQLAIDSYIDLDKDKIRDIGQHLAIYGLFQALYVQQDSVLNLCKSTDIPLPKEKDIKTQHPELYEIRQLRDKGIGHPTPKGENNPKDTHSMLIVNDSIKLFSYTEISEFSFKEYKISDCIEQQELILCRFMQQVIERMESIEKKHKDKYMQDKLKNCFPDDLRYRIGKIFEAINLIEAQSLNETASQEIGRKEGIRLAFSHSKALIEAIEKFDVEITKRDLYEVYVYIEIERSKYPLEKIKEFFSSQPESFLNSQDARAYADSAELHILELIKHAERLDNEYASIT